MESNTAHLHVHSGLRNIEVMPHQISQMLNIVRRSSAIASGANRSFAIYGVPEHYIRTEKQRKLKIWYHLANGLRMSDLPRHVAINGAVCLERWREFSGSSRRDLRQTVSKFHKARHIKRFLAKSDKLKTMEMAEITVG